MHNRIQELELEMIQVYVESIFNSVEDTYLGIIKTHRTILDIYDRIKFLTALNGAAIALIAILTIFVINS